MTKGSPSRNRPNVLLFPVITGSKPDRPTRPAGPARVIYLAERLTTRGRLAAKRARLTTIEEA